MKKYTYKDIRTGIVYRMDFRHDDKPARILFMLKSSGLYLLDSENGLDKNSVRYVPGGSKDRVYTIANYADAALFIEKLNAKFPKEHLPVNRIVDHFSID